jgi:hypothetical protein
VHQGMIDVFKAAEVMLLEGKTEGAADTEKED